MDDLIYLDNAATSYPKPDIMHDTVRDFYRENGVNPGRTGCDMALRAEEMISDTRKRLSSFFNPGLTQAGKAKDPDRLVFTLNATMNLFGIMMELHNQHTQKVNWTAFIYGCVAGFVPWVVIMLYFVGAVNSGDAKPPDFVYAIVPTLFVFFNIFAINMVLQYKKVGPWKDYLFGERVYIILSLSAKSVLCWLIWTGTLAPV